MVSGIGLINVISIAIDVKSSDTFRRRTYNAYCKMKSADTAIELNKTHRTMYPFQRTK